jgi:hypothetical protein
MACPLITCDMPCASLLAAFWTSGDAICPCARMCRSQGTYGGAAPSESLRAEWHGVTSRALSRMSATPDNDVVPMDPALVNQMQNLCQRLGLAVSSDPEALLEHLVAWGHKVRLCRC